MNNQVILIGRIVNELTIDSDTKNCEITIAISRAFKNEDGIYETDLIPVTLKETTLFSSVTFLTGTLI